MSRLFPGYAVVGLLLACATTSPHSAQEASEPECAPAGSGFTRGFEPEVRHFTSPDDAWMQRARREEQERWRQEERHRRECARREAARREREGRPPLVPPLLSREKPWPQPSGPGMGPVLVSISVPPPASPDARPSVAEGLARDPPGDPASPRLLANLVLEGRYQEVQRALDALKRNEVSRQLVMALSDDELGQLARPAEGNLLLGRLFDEVTSGHANDEELRQAWRLLGAEARRRYPSPEDFAQAAAHTRIFSYESMGVTNAGAPLSARRRTDGKIQVHLTVRSFGNDYRQDALTLSGQDYVLEPDEEVGVRLYDDGGVLMQVPALFLVQLSNADDVRVAGKMVELGVLGLMLGAFAPEALAAEASAAVRTSTLARALATCDRIALAVGMATSLVLEHRHWMLSHFGEDGRAFLYSMEVLNSALALYGVTRVAMAAPNLVRAVRTFYGPVAAQARLQRQLAGLTRREAAELDDFLKYGDGLFGNLETLRNRPPGSGAVAGQAGPAPAGGKVLPFERLRQPGRPPEAGALPMPAEAREFLALTGTDGPPVVIRGQGPTGDAPVASLKRPRQGGTRGSTSAPFPKSPAPTFNTAPSPQPSPSTGRLAPAVEAPGNTPGPSTAPGEGQPGATLAANQDVPGEWAVDAKELKPKSMPIDSRSYQSQVTHHPPGEVYIVKNVKKPDGTLTDVKFDGLVPGKEFQECKGPGYDQFLDPERPGYFLWWFEKSQINKKMVPQAKIQLEAAGGRLPVRWYVAERKAADAIETLLHENGAEEVEVIYQPFIPPKGTQ